MKIRNDIKYLGVNDHEVDLFEGQYVVPNGMAYNSYAIIDENIAIFDTVDNRFSHQWLDNVQDALDGKNPDYLIISHMEPDHSSSILEFMKVYPYTKIVSTSKAFVMMEQFFGTQFNDNQVIATEGMKLSLGKHELTFIMAPMVHWPEVMVTYDSYDKALFSADAFGKFGALDVEEDWACEARRYYFGIVGKYGAQAQSLLKKASTLDIQVICPLHGPILTENLGYYLDLYNTWSSYQSESEGIVIAYTSVYGNTKKAVYMLAEKLKEKGAPRVVVTDLARDDMAEAVEDAFRHNKLVLATTTYNGEIFPFMKTFIDNLVERNFQNKTIAFIENGTWAPVAINHMKALFENSKNLTFTENNVTIRSAVSNDNVAKIDKLAEELCREYSSEGKTQRDDLSTALYKIGYGLYVITSNNGKTDNGMIVNTVCQHTLVPKRISVTINKENYTHHVVKQTGIMNVNFLTEEAPFSVFEKFGFKSGRVVDKFAGESPKRSANGLVVLDDYINGYMSLKVEDYIDLGSYGMFLCSIAEAKVVSDKPSMTYAYYQDNVKPKPKSVGKKAYACRICGYVYEGEILPEGFTCPICKHPAEDFEVME